MKFKQSTLKKFVIPVIMVLIIQTSPTLSINNQSDFSNFILAVNLKCTYPEAVAKKKKLKSADWFLKRAKKANPQKLEDQFNQRLTAKAKEFIPQLYPEGVKLALDITKSPVYTKSKSSYITGGEAEKGTTQFYQFLGAGVLERQVKFPLNFHLMRKGELKKLGGIVRNFIQQISQFLKIRLVILDRGFFWSSVVKEIQECSQPFIIGMKKTLNVKKILDKLMHSKLAKRKSFVLQKPRYRVERMGDNCWRIQDFSYGKPLVTVQLVLWRHKIKKKKNQRRKISYLDYSAFITSPEIDPLQVLELYGTRWRIETAFRQIRQVWGKTRVINPSVRIWLFGVACLLYASWVHRHAPSSMEKVIPEGSLDWNLEKEYQAWMRARISVREMQDQYLAILEACLEMVV